MQTFMSRGSPRLPDQSWWQFYGGRRFCFLLANLVVLLAGPPILLEFGFSAVWFDAFMTLLLLAAILSFCLDRRQRRFAVLLGVPTLVFSVGGQTLWGATGAWLLLVGHVCQVIFLIGAAGLIVKSIFHSGSLSFDSIVGAVCGYVFLGLGWAVFYCMVESFQPGSFAISPSLRASHEHARELPHLLTYYSFITLTTVGYGDILAVSPATRTCAWIEAMTGQFYMAVIVAGLVSMIFASRTKPTADRQGNGTRHAQAIDDDMSLY